MKYITFILTTLSVFFGLGLKAQTKTLPLNDGANLKIYQLEPTSKTGSQTTAKVAVSYNKGNEDPIFGMMWVQGNTVESGNQILIQQVKVNDLRIPQLNDETETAVKNHLVQNADKLNFSLSKSQFDNALELYQKEVALSKNIKNTTPKIIYSKKPAILVLVDGTPNYQKNEELGVNLVVNSPFAIVQHTDGKHYIYGGKNWYVANTLKGNYSITTSLPAKISQVESALKKYQQENDSQEFEEFDENTIYDVIVSTEPAELIQSNGEPNFSPVSGTNLLYVDNSSDDIFMDINSQQYYTLLAGRWYSSNNLNGNWKYIPSSDIPSDFAKIIEGSSKDNVLASVAGTDAANEAVLDAQIPQTAKVSRNANTTIEYDGSPRFENIEGTNLEYAVNTPTSVIKYQGRYFAVEDGVWYVSNSPSGPWVVSTERPNEVTYIPPSSPVYNVKYVYVYDVTPNYVYMGYTPGYLNTYIYGPTVVYGTGYHYRPWIGNYYYARPHTWGFGIRYNPWYGFGFGFNYYSGWFYNPWRYNSLSWWGPRLYRPSYVYRPYGFRGHMVRSGYYSNRYYNNYRSQIHRGIRNNNIYNGRRDVYTMDRGRVVNPNSNNRITRPPRNVERNNIARNQNPNSGNLGRFDRNNMRRESVAPNNGTRIDRSYRNNNAQGTFNGNRNESIARPNQGQINNRGNVTRSRENGINRDYRNENNNGSVTRPNRTFQNPSGQRAQIAENRINPNTRVSPNTGVQPRTNQSIGAPQSQRDSRNQGQIGRQPVQSQGGINRGTVSPQRQSGSIQRNSDRSVRSTPSVNRNSGGQQRSTPSVNRGSSQSRSTPSVNRSSGQSRSTPSVNRSGGGQSRSGGTPSRSVERSRN